MRRSAEDEDILRAPEMLRPGAVASQPEHAVDAAQVESLGCVVVVRKGPGRDRHRARGCAVLGDWLANEPFGLVQKLQPEVGTKFQRTKRQIQIRGLLHDLLKRCTRRATMLLTESSTVSMSELVAEVVNRSSAKRLCAASLRATSAACNSASNSALPMPPMRTDRAAGLLVPARA
jgi:hypothetical protein